MRGLPVEAECAMKRRPSREVSCSGKGSMTAQDAKRLARHLREKGDRVVPYLCIHCNGWHVGNTMVKKGNRRRRLEELEVRDG